MTKGSIIAESSSVIAVESGGGVVEDYLHFYEFGDSGLGYTDDTADPPTNLTDDNTTQFDDPIQGFVAMMDAAPTDQGFTNLGQPSDITGDMTYTCVFKPDSTSGKAILTAASGVANFIFVNNSTTIRTRTNGTIKDFTVPTISTGTFYHLIASYTGSDNSVRVYLNDVESSSGALIGGTLWDLDAIANHNGVLSTGNDWLGDIAKIRVYERILTSGERTLIFGADLKS